MNSYTSVYPKILLMVLVMYTISGYFNVLSVLGVEYSKMKIAQEYSKKGKYDQAEAIYQDIILHDPNNVDVLLKLGNLYSEKLNTLKAEELFVQAAEIDHDHSDVHLYQGINFYRMAKKFTPISPEYLLKAENSLKKYLLSKPQSSDASHWYGLILMERGKLQEALKKMVYAIDVDPMNSDAYAHLGKLYIKLDKPGLAIDAFQKAIEFDPYHFLPYQYLGEFYASIGKPNDALKYFNKAKFYSPIDRYEIRYQLAQVYDLLGDAENALSNYEIAFLLNPYHQDSLLQFADLAYKHGKIEPALEAYRKVIALDESVLDVLLSQGDHYYRQGLYKLAKGIYSKVLLIVPKNTHAAHGAANAVYASWFLGIDNNLEESQHIADLLQEYIHTQTISSKIVKLKMLMSLQGSSSETEAILDDIIREKEEGLEPDLCIGEALFLKEKYLAAYSRFKKVLLAYQSSTDSQSIVNDLLFFVDRLTSIGDTVVAKEALDILETLGKTDESVTGLEAISKRLQTAEELLKLGLSFISQGEDKEGIKYIIQSLAYNPENANTHLQVAYFYADYKMYDKALQHLLLYKDIETIKRASLINDKIYKRLIVTWEKQILQTKH